MNTEQKIKDAGIVRQMVELAEMDVETALAVLDASSDNQRDFAAWVRVEALAGIWESRIKDTAKNQKMATAIINAANKYSSAKWWLDHKSHIITRGGFMDDLKQDVKVEMSK